MTSNKKDFADFVAERFKEVRLEIGLKQSDVSKGIEKMLESGEMILKTETKTDSKPMPQHVISIIEKNNGGARKEKIYALIKYYELKHDINPAYFFSDSGHVRMRNMENFFDLGGKDITKKEIEEIFEKYEIDFFKIKDELINDIVDSKNK